ncbi:hypothetical protein [Shewanella fodinae]|uniref:Uncharacterized protein n=1 Tax=Shewanella fodinae TaxID=552357 RepID=A0A4V2RS76_9GAMM|nr:hypothetical protein [Shewanella fodinae]TCN83097.1 hypothetical protein EDC91_11677 [Shewanella fodinae]
MSRWVLEFNNHPFKEVWKNIEDISNSITLDDESVESDVEEIARFKKVVTYISNILISVDPELIPSSTWKNFLGQSQPCLTQLEAYNKNRNIQHVIQANAHIDNLLSYLKPYSVSSSEQVVAYNKAVMDYAEGMSSGLVNFKNKVDILYSSMKEQSEDINSTREKVLENYNEIDGIYKELEELRKEYFSGSDSEKSVQEKIILLIDQTEEIRTKILAYHDELLDSGSDSISEIIKEAKDKSINNSSEISELLDQTEIQLKELKSFYLKVVGKENDEGVVSGGLKQEIEDRKDELDKFKTLQEKRYLALNNQIEELLPGATSAGLATAYRVMRKSFSKPIAQYSKLFYLSIVILIFIAFISSIESAGTVSPYITFIDVSNLQNLVKNLAHKLPFILPVIWLAMFASKRRSEALRLQQEYAHKEAISKSYQSFKNQIDALQSEHKEQLMEKLLAAAISAVSTNASSTLDGKHEEKTPINLGLDTIVNQLEKIKALIK